METIEKLFDTNEAVNRFNQKTGIYTPNNVIADEKYKGIKPLLFHDNDGLRGAFVLSANFVYETTLPEKEFLLIATYMQKVHRTTEEDLKSKSSAENRKGTILTLTFGTLSLAQQIHALYEATTGHSTKALGAEIASFVNLGFAGLAYIDKTYLERAKVYQTDLSTIELTDNPQAAISSLRKLEAEKKANPENTVDRNWFNFKDFTFKDHSMKELITKFFVEKIVEPIARQSVPDTEARIKNIEKAYNLDKQQAQAL